MGTGTPLVQTITKQPKFVATLVDRDGKRYYYDMDASSGPMATGAPYWSEYEGLYPLSAERAFEVAANPRIGWGGMPNNISSYHVELFEIGYTRIPTADIDRRRTETLREKALSKLNSDEKRALGIEE